MLEKLASSLGRNDEEPNIALALALAKSRDANAIKEIIGGLSGTTEIASDCIKVLYELGGRAPELISGYAEVFIKLLQSKNNRLVWGAMTALAEITALNPEAVNKHFDAVVAAYTRGSVITVDNSISVFAELAKAGKKYEKKAFPVIINHLENCRPKEVAQHAERACVCVHQGNAEVFRGILLKRYGSLTDAQKKRLDKLLKRLPA